jgi:LmbE family N-acetylglucosaminyl deacetylase
VHLKLVRSPAFVVDTSDTWETKRASLACYASQFDETAAKPTVLDRVEAASRWWGATIGTLHGEPFSSREPVALRGFSDLF